MKRLKKFGLSSLFATIVAGLGCGAILLHGLIMPPNTANRADSEIKAGSLIDTAPILITAIPDTDQIADTGTEDIDSESDVSGNDEPVAESETKVPDSQTKPDGMGASHDTNGDTQPTKPATKPSSSNNNPSSNTGNNSGNSGTSSNSSASTAPVTPVIDNPNPAQPTDYPDQPAVAKASFYPYYGMLSSTERIIYNELKTAITNYETELRVSNSPSRAEAENAIEAVYNDHPEFFWVEPTFSYQYTSNSRVTKIMLSYDSSLTTAAAKATFDSKVNAIISGARSRASDYDKEKYVHDAILAGSVYDLSANNSQSAYSALVTGRTVCAGFARAFQHIMIKLGIPTYYVSGTATGEPHAWNMVQLSDGFYNVDLTWDNKLGTYNYFNVSDTVFSKTHARNNLAVYLPAATATKYATR